MSEKASLAKRRSLLAKQLDVACHSPAGSCIGTVYIDPQCPHAAHLLCFQALSARGRFSRVILAAGCSLG